jgi:2'-5' RNA ligase/GNAT superfamily N-acetyltransferase
MAKIRFGVALVIDEPIARDIDVLRRALGDGALQRIMPHITIVPPVNIDESRVDACLEILRDAAIETRPFHVSLGDVATFMPANPVIYLNIDPAKEVLRLRDSVFRGPLNKKEDHEFVPHVTICDEASEEKINGALLALSAYRQETTFDRIHLLRKDTNKPWYSFADFVFSAQRTIGTGGLEVKLDVSEVVSSDAARFLDREWRPQLNTQFGPGRLNYEPAVTVARREGEIVGVLQAELRPPACHIREVFIGAAYRGQGIANHLLATLDDVLRQKNCSRLTYSVLKDCEAETYFRAKGWVDDNDVVVEEFGRKMVRLTRSI